MIYVSSGFSQDRHLDLALIEHTINNYFEGYVERDIDKLNLAFDIENGTMKVPILSNNIVTGYENRFFKELVITWGKREKLSAERLKNCTLKILNIDMDQGKIATAKISMKVEDVTYIDILSLQKINNQWKITNKIYHTLYD
ncbi:MAG: nuclear transport factor 2 family protein [Psychroserpens sp.]